MSMATRIATASGVNMGWRNISRRRRLAKYIPKDQLGATDDCGFSPFSIDVKPKHGSPDVARDIAFQKITNRLKGAEMASRKLGLAAAA
jgi:hypothetical protein